MLERIQHTVEAEIIATDAGFLANWKRDQMGQIMSMIRESTHNMEYPGSKGIQLSCDLRNVHILELDVKLKTEVRGKEAILRPVSFRAILTAEVVNLVRHRRPAYGADGEDIPQSAGYGTTGNKRRFTRHISR